MNRKTLELIERLKSIDTTLARVWSDDCAVALADQAAYNRLSERQQGQVDRLRKIDSAFAAGQNPADDLYIISDGAFKSF